MSINVEGHDLTHSYKIIAIDIHECQYLRPHMLNVISVIPDH